ncbi:MAG: PEP-CTERM sorting domain-containing protein [Planctomycetales bacterium]|nr:PEP-CTERM sorting domain-containing protein [Planctomycetales bacterium]
MRWFDCRLVLATALVLVATCGQAATIYIVNDIGLVKSFSGVDVGASPITGGSFGMGSGVLRATIPAYGEYQGMTQTPDGRVLGVNSGGDVVAWNGIAAWLANAVPNTLAADVFADKVNGNGPAAGGGPGTIHGLSYDGNTGGFYVVLEAADAADGDIRQYATLADLLSDNGISTESNYGGNLLNFYYPDEDAPGNRPSPNDTPGANYFQVAGSGQIEGFLTLADYIADPNIRTFQQASFGSGLRVGFAVVPEPATVILSVLGVGCLSLLRRRATA